MGGTMWVRGREAPGESGPGGPWSTQLCEKGGGCVYKTADPMLFFRTLGDDYAVCRWTRGYRGNKRQAHPPMVLVVGNQSGRCDIETAP